MTGIEIETRDAHPKRESLCEVRPQQVEMAWRAWILDEVHHSIIQIRRAPQSIGRPASGKHTCNDKREAVSPVSKEMVSERVRTYIWGIDSNTS
jgi:hypothetical protein